MVVDGKTLLASCIQSKLFGAIIPKICAKTILQMDCKILDMNSGQSATVNLLSCMIVDCYSPY